MLLQTADAHAVPQVVAQTVRELFAVPQVALRDWGMHSEFDEAAHVYPPAEGTQTFPSSLAEPFCGPNPGFDVVQWLDEPFTVASVAVLPLGEAAGEPAFGVLVMGSDDAQRFAADMGTKFLNQMAQLASAALQRLRTSQLVGAAWSLPLVFETQS